MRRTPGFSAAIVLTLALGIGATTAVFSVVYGALFRPLPYPDPDRLVVIRLERVLEGAQRPVRAGFPLGDLEELQSRAHAFASFALVSSEQATLSHGGFNHQVNAASVSPSFFVTVGGAMRSGRAFTSEKEPSSIVISDRLRRRLFGEEEAIGRTLVLGKRSYAVVGIASRAFQIPAADTDVWLPASGSNCCPYAAVARLKPAVSLEQASADVQAMLPLFAATSPRVYAGARGLVIPLREELAGDVRRPLLVLLGLVGLLLSVACANAANLLVARNAARWREMAVRIALGASPQRLRLQSLAEASLIATAAGVLGIALTVGVIDALLWLPLEGVPRLGIDATAIRIDLPVFFFSVGTAAITAVFMGLLPTLTHRTGVANVRVDLRGAGISSGPARRRLDDVLVVAQLAVSVVLLVAAGLLGRSLVRLVTTDIGVRPDHVATAAIDVAYQRHLTDAQQSSLVDMVLQRVRLLPDVQAAGAGAALPPSASTIRLTLKRFGDSVDYQATAVPATPGYFSALGARLIDGRFFSDADREGQPEVTIMTLDTARRFFGDGNPIGRTIALPVLRNGAAGTAQATLVGVIANVRFRGSTPRQTTWCIAPCVSRAGQFCSSSRGPRATPTCSPRCCGGKSQPLILRSSSRRSNRWRPSSQGNRRRRGCGAGWRWFSPAARWPLPWLACTACLHSGSPAGRKSSACAWRWAPAGRTWSNWCSLKVAGWYQRAFWWALGRRPRPAGFSRACVQEIRPTDGVSTSRSPLACCWSSQPSRSTCPHGVSPRRIPSPLSARSDMPAHLLRHTVSAAWNSEIASSSRRCVSTRPTRGARPTGT